MAAVFDWVFVGPMPEKTSDSVLETEAETLTIAAPIVQERELNWQINELKETLTNLKLSLQDCYNLLDPGSIGNTLVISTPRNEIVKGFITVSALALSKGTYTSVFVLYLNKTITIDPANPIKIASLETIETLLTQSIDLLAFTLTYSYASADSETVTTPLPPFHGRKDAFIAAQLRVLAQTLSEATSLLRGPPLTMADPAWTSGSASLSHFSPPLSPNISFQLGLQDSQLVLWLRALEPADAPVNFGMKFALALGTTRRLDHDEADQVFTYCTEDGTATGLHPSPPPSSAGDPNVVVDTPEGPAEVYVREKIRIETADPSLLSLSAKLNALTIHSAWHAETWRC